MIWNYGLHWRADRVWWGTRGGSHKGGALYGVTTRSAPMEDRVDFRGQTGIYALYSDEKLVYVGQAGTGERGLFMRLNDHRRVHRDEWKWNNFSWFGALRVVNGQLTESDTIMEYIRLGHKDVEEFNKDIERFTEKAMDISEAISIGISNPSYNRQGGIFKKWNITQYYQCYGD